MARLRSRRIGLLTDNERHYLSGKINLDSKLRSKFLNSLLMRIDACSEDLNLIWQRRKNDQVIANWCSINFNDLYNIGQSIHIRNTMQVAPAVLGRVKFITKKRKGKEKGVRYYWFDANDGPKQYLDKPLNQSQRFIGIKPHTVRMLIAKAFRLGLIPNNKKQAVTVQQIKSKLRRKKTSFL